MNPRNLQWSKFFPNHLEYASKVRPMSSESDRRERDSKSPYQRNEKDSKPPKKRKRKDEFTDLKPDLPEPEDKAPAYHAKTPPIIIHPDQPTIEVEPHFVHPATSDENDNETLTSSQGVQVDIRKKPKIPKQTNQGVQVNIVKEDNFIIHATQSTISTQTDEQGKEIIDSPHIGQNPNVNDTRRKETDKPVKREPDVPEYPPQGKSKPNPSSSAVPKDLPINDGSSTWRAMLSLGEPRVVISVIGAYNDATSKFSVRDSSLIKQALRNVVIQAGSKTWAQVNNVFQEYKRNCSDGTAGQPKHVVGCGFLFRKKGFSCMPSIIDNASSLECLDGVTYRYIDTMYSQQAKHAVQESTGLDQMTDKLQYHEQMLKVEKFINREALIKFQLNQSNFIRVPVAILVINGDLYTLEHIVKALSCDISVVVMKGSGGVADLIALCLENPKNLRRISLHLFTHFSKQLYASLEEVMKGILEREWMVSVFDLQKDTNETLWERLTDGILLAWSFEGSNEKNKSSSLHSLLNKKPIFPDRGLSISTYVVGIDWLSKLEIFGGFNLHGRDNSDNNMEVLVNAVFGNHTHILRDILSGNTFDMNFEQLANLYQKTLNSTQITGPDNITIVLQKIEPQSFEVLQKKETSPIEVDKAVDRIANKLLKGLCFSKIGMATCCGTNCKRCTKNTNPTIKDHSRPSVDDLLRYGVFTNNVPSSGEWWINSKHPMLTALICSCYLTSLADKAEEMFNDSLQESLIEHSKLFSKRAVILLDKLYKVDNNMATYALDYVTEIWGHLENPLHFAQQFNMEEFISHTSAQKDASKRLYAFVPDQDAEQNGNNEADIDSKNALYITEKQIEEEFSLTAFFKTHRNRPWNFVKAPLTKVLVHSGVFLAALIMFSIFLTTNLRPESISLMEVLVFIFILGDVFEEIWSMLRPRDGIWSPQRILLHLLNVWNILDLVSFILFFCAFIMHLFSDGNNSLILHIRRLYSVCLFIMFLRLLNLLLLIKRFGIIIIMVKEMLKDLFEYLVILLILICGAGVVYQANVYPNNPLSEFTSQVWSLLKIPYWQVYGELYLDTLEGSNDSCTNNETEWMNGNGDRCPSGDWITTTIAAFYMMLTNWLLLNIVIAMFSSRFEYIKEKSEQKWRYYRHAVIITYEHWIPSPFNLVLRPFLIIYHTVTLPCSGCQCLERKSKGNEKEMLEKQKELAKTIIDEENNNTKTNK